jgi:hypothetical protein
MKSDKISEQNTYWGINKKTGSKLNYFPFRKLSVNNFTIFVSEFFEAFVVLFHGSVAHGHAGESTVVI